MKTIYILPLLVFAMFTSLHAQENKTNSIAIGDTLILGEPSGSSYKHIAVPRKNFIIKRGGIANMSTLENSWVTVTDILYGKETSVIFKRSNKRKFFRVYKTMTANLDKALDSGELKLPKK